MGRSDEALLAGLAAGDRDASAEFVRRFQRRAFGLARTIVDDSATAEDVAQQAFVRAWRPAGSYNGRPGIARQVTVDGRLLYRFMEDPDNGVVTGNGFADSFDGRAFTWHVATPTGISTTSDNSTSSGDSPGSMYR